MKYIRVEDIKIVRTANQDGTINTHFLNIDKPCLVYEIKGELSEKCANLQLIIKDFESTIRSIRTAMKIIKELTANPEDYPFKFNPLDERCINLESLTLSSIVTYCKCDTSSNLRKGKQSIHTQSVKPLLNEHQLATHKKIKSMRDKWLAHNDKNHIETPRSLLILDPTQELDAAYLHNVGFGTSLSNESFAEFLELAEKTMQIFTELLHIQSGELREKIILNLDPFAVYREAQPHLTSHLE